MANISEINNCYGCGVCSKACSKRIIDLKLNVDGFYKPYITNKDKCVDCGLCLDVCSFNKNILASSSHFIKSYGGWSLDKDTRRTCSSGGVAFEISKTLLDEGYKIIGVRYNVQKQRAEHYVSNTIEEFIESKGSKYLQSYTVDALKNIDRHEKYLFIGTPCQVDSLRHYLNKFHLNENFILIDFYCHGVPSYNLWKKYLDSYKKKFNSITKISWRNKTKGWYDSYAMRIEGIDKDCKEYAVERFASKGDNFYKFFLGDLCLCNACYDNCKYKGIHSSADIRIGDLWGDLYLNNKEGVNAVISYTIKGDEILKKSHIHLQKHNVEDVMQGQMLSMPLRPSIYNKVCFILRKESSTMYDLLPIVNRFLFMQKIKRGMKNPILIFRHIINKFR